MAEPSQTTPTTNRTITVLYFAAALTATGVQSETVDLPPLPRDESASSDVDVDAGFPLAALGELLVQRHAATNLKEVLKTSQWSVDAEMVDDPELVTLQGGEEVAIICPVSGG